MTDTLAERRPSHLPSTRQDLGLRTTFRKQLPSEVVLRFVRRCASRLNDTGHLEVTIEPRAGRHHVQIRDRIANRTIDSDDPDVLLAVRNAFDLWQVQGDPTHSAPRDSSSCHTHDL